MRSEYEVWKDEIEHGRRKSNPWITIAALGFALGFGFSLILAARYGLV